MSMKRIIYSKGDLVGECTFMGNETPIKVNGIARRLATFKCRCGSLFEYRVDIIRKGRIKSCGCVYKKGRSLVAKTHGYASHVSPTGEYTAWENMISRCYNKNNIGYNNYGGRGIKVCKKWLKFSNFILDMGDKPSKIHSLDRIENDKGYYKENCRWATKKQQINNRRNTVYVDYMGKKRPLSEWATVLGLPYRSLLHRVTVVKWPIEDAFKIPFTRGFGRKYSNKKISI